MATIPTKSSSPRATLSRARAFGARAALLAAPWLVAGALGSVSCATSPTGAKGPQADATGCPNAHGAGCGPHGSGAGQPGGMMQADCPMNVSGTSVQAVDTEGGAALEFSTTGDIAEVRRRVAHLADMHNHGGPGGGMMGGGMMAGGGMMDGGAMQEHGMMGGGMADGGMMQGHGMMGDGMMQDHGMMGDGMMQDHGMMGMDAVATAQDTPQGARLVFTPKDPKDLDALRRHVKEHAGHAEHAEHDVQGCPMMSMH
jgi:hypothetical protein